MTVSNNNGWVTLLALAIGVVGGALAHKEALQRNFGTFARVASVVAGFIIGFLLVQFVVSLI